MCKTITSIFVVVFLVSSIANGQSVFSLACNAPHGYGDKNCPPTYTDLKCPTNVSAYNPIVVQEGLQIEADPNTGYYYVRMVNSQKIPSDFEILDIEGHTVKTLSSETNKTISMQLALVPGSYVITCIYGTEVRSAKIVIR